jgi:hypothetical protein
MKVFLSYSREDQTFVELLREDLMRLHHDVWFDRVLIGGQEWWDEILKQIRECDVFALALSPNSIESEACLLELRYARALNRPFIPAMVLLTDPNHLPQELVGAQYVDYTKNRWESALDIAAALANHPAAPPLPDPLPQPPAMPQSELYDARQLINLSAELDWEHQNRLLDTLVRSSRRPRNRAEVLELLEEFRHHPYVMADILKKLDDLSESLATTRRAYGDPERDAVKSSLHQEETVSASDFEEQKNTGTLTSEPTGTSNGSDSPTAVPASSGKSLGQRFRSLPRVARLGFIAATLLLLYIAVAAAVSFPPFSSSPNPYGKLAALVPSSVYGSAAPGTSGSNCKTSTEHVQGVTPTAGYACQPNALPAGVIDYFLFSSSADLTTAYNNLVSNAANTTLTSGNYCGNFTSWTPTCETDWHTHTWHGRLVEFKDQQGNAQIISTLANEQLLVLMIGPNGNSLFTWQVGNNWVAGSLNSPPP